MVDGLRVTVLVPTFNRANYIAECLDSLLAQTMPALEIIVIDDGSEDGTAQLLKSYEGRIRYVRKENGGKPTAVNLGLSLAQGELIWIFDDDDVALPRAIENRVQTLAGAPEAGFVFSPHFYGTDGSDGRIARGALHQFPTYTSESFLFELMKGCFFHLATALVRKEAYLAVGGFDVGLLSSEDYDMQLRLARAYPMVCSPQPSFVFRQHTGLRGAKAIRYSGDQREKTFRKFDQRVGLKLRASLQLGDYLVPRQNTIDDKVKERQAYLARMTVMASKACMAEMVEDLTSALALLPPDESLSPTECETVTQAICTGYAPDSMEHEWLGFKALLARLPTTNAGREAVMSIARGLFRLAKGYPDRISVRWSRLCHAGSLAVLSLPLRKAIHTRSSIRNLDP